MCLRGSSEVDAVLSKNPDDRVRAYVVWVPMLYGRERDVPEASATLDDPRARHFWDGDGLTVTSFVPVLGVPASRGAWDVYLIYGPNARWDGPTPPAPQFWMHQLSGVTAGPYLDRAEFAEHLAEALASAR